MIFKNYKCVAFLGNVERDKIFYYIGTLRKIIILVDIEVIGIFFGKVGSITFTLTF